MKTRLAALAALTALSASSLHLGALPFINHGPAQRFIDFEVHGIFGGTGITQNLSGCFSQVADLSNMMRPAGGIGCEAAFGFTDFVWLGVGLDLIFGGHRLNMAIADDDATSITNCFIRNRFTLVDFPVFMSFRFNLGPAVRWNVDGGIYYSNGLGGSQTVNLYVANVNPVNQLITTLTSDKNPYYNSPEAFIWSSYRSDWGLHIATGITVSDHVDIGVRAQIGFKNIAHTYNSIKTPNIHNYKVMATVGYHF